MIKIPRPDGASVEPITMWAARINAGLTLAEASKAIGVTGPALRRLELGGVDIKLRHALDLCKIYGKDLWDIKWPEHGDKPKTAETDEA